jgi:competence protein ComEA
MAHVRGEPGEPIAARPSAPDAGDPARPLPPPPTFGELLDVCRQRFRLRHPGWDATRVVLVAAAVVGLMGMAWAVLRGPGTSGGPTSERVGAVTTVGLAPFASTTTGPPPTTVASSLVVDVAGAVERPGPIRVDVGSRVADAIRMAGGPSADADLERVDRAAPLHDGERIYVPRRGQTEVPQVVGAVGPAPSGGAPADGGSPRPDGSDATPAVVNLNTADVTALEALPGVGPATAQAILDYRQAHGRFSAVDDLLDVKGIGPAKFTAIKAHVTV